MGKFVSRSNIFFSVASVNIPFSVKGRSLDYIEYGDEKLFISINIEKKTGGDCR